MLEHAYYSVISPEGCAGILWKAATEASKPDGGGVPLAAHFPAILREARSDRRCVTPEPLGGAHRDAIGARRPICQDAVPAALSAWT